MTNNFVQQGSGDVYKAFLGNSLDVPEEEVESTKDQVYTEVSAIVYTSSILDEGDDTDESYETLIEIE